MEQKIFEHFLRVRSVTTDTRKIAMDTIYFALKGERFNGNTFAPEALRLGASMVVVDEDVLPGDSRAVLVGDVLTTLQNVGLLYRRSLKIPFLAITGSNGKTTTKELVRDVLSRKYRVSATQGNLNNHIGIPLTILAIPEDCEFAVIEMGANHRGEISSYCKYVEPDFGLITNMGKAHLEGFGGEEGVVLGKKELYDYLHAHQRGIFVNIELEKLKRASEGMKILPYGFSCGDFRLECTSESPVVTYRYQSNAMQGEFVTQLAGFYNLFNIASAIAVGRYFGVAEQEIHSAITGYRPDNNRSQLRQTEKNMLIMDAYNANPTSMEYALDGLARQVGNSKYFVIGDMLELGDSAIQEHRQILRHVQKLALQGIVVGPIFKSMAAEFGITAFQDNISAKNFLSTLELKDHIILIKGSRGIKLEEVIPAL